MTTALPIRIEKLSKRYGDFRALADVDLAVAPGEFLTLLGPSGSGKTTLLMAVAGFVRPDGGAIRIGDQDLVRLPANRRNIGVVFQNYALFPHMTVLANVLFPLRVRRVDGKVAQDRALAALAKVRLDHLAGRQIADLSGGQRQRVALARAIVFEPRIMLMDEPLSALDKNLREQMQIEIRRLHDDLGITTIYVTHDQREALTMSDRIAVMDKGVIAQIDTPTRLYAQPNSDFVAGFMGEANILMPADLEIAGALAGKTGRLMIRAESFRLSAEEVGTPCCRVRGRLQARVFRGENWLMQLALAGGGQVVLSIPAAGQAPAAELAPGQEVVAYAALGSVHAIPQEQAA